jgi:hypothetical protein
MLQEAIKVNLAQITDSQNKVHRKNVDFLFVQLTLIDSSSLEENQTQDYLDLYENRAFLCENIKTLLFPENIERIDSNLVFQFMKGLMCPNNSQNDFKADVYDGDKQLYLTWALQKAKDVHKDLKSLDHARKSYE